MIPKAFSHDDPLFLQQQLQLAKELEEKRRSRLEKSESLEDREKKFIELTKQGSQERAEAAINKEAFYKAIYGATFGEIEEENKKDVDSDKK